MQQGAKSSGARTRCLVPPTLVFFIALAAMGVRSQDPVPLGGGPPGAGPPPPGAGGQDGPPALPPQPTLVNGTLRVSASRASLQASPEVTASFESSFRTQAGRLVGLVPEDVAITSYREDAPSAIGFRRRALQDGVATLVSFQLTIPAGRVQPVMTKIQSVYLAQVPLRLGQCGAEFGDDNCFQAMTSGLTIDATWGDVKADLDMVTLSSCPSPQTIPSAENALSMYFVVDMEATDVSVWVTTCGYTGDASITWWDSSWDSKNALVALHRTPLVGKACLVEDVDEAILSEVSAQVCCAEQAEHAAVRLSIFVSIARQMHDLGSPGYDFHPCTYCIFVAAVTVTGAETLVISYF
jgi:hypothetical protein